jgi:3-deoxy-D-manno-octulosonic-acid transferase
MSVLLDLIYLILLVLASPWILYRLLVTGDWRSLAMRFGRRLGAGTNRCIWLHGSSAGEVSLLKPLVALLERDLPDMPLVISAYTSTGLQVARSMFSAHTVIAFPIDFSFVVRRSLRKFNPLLVVVVESEFWPNFLLALSDMSIPAVVLNGKISAKSHALHERTRLIPKVLGSLQLLAVQQEEYAERFRSLGVAAERIEVTGNMKYDLALRRPDRQSGSARRRLAYRDEDIVVIGGSLHEGEDQVLLDAFGDLAKELDRLALIVVPRYPADAAKVKQRVERAGHRAVLKTELDRGLAPPVGREGVLIVDTVGQLGDLYAVADIAFVGGSLYYRGANKGGHNLMEPAILGLPVLFGPYNFSFKETVDVLLAADAGVLVRDRSELKSALERLARDATARHALGERARQVILGGQGATQRNYELIGRLLDRKASRLQPKAQPRTMPPASSDPGSP